MSSDSAPIVEAKDHGETSVLSPRVLMERARQARCLPYGRVPPVSVLDPDGLLIAPEHTVNPAWACFHTKLMESSGLHPIGVVSRAVGGAFAVLVAEQLVEMGARLIISMASAGALGASYRIGDIVLIGSCLRDEGTSYHYLPPAAWVDVDADVEALAERAVERAGMPYRRACSWTTDAPYRETPTSVAAARARGAALVEMEGAALYAFGAARSVPVLCLAQVTNRLGTHDEDFAKPAGTPATRLRVVHAIADAWAQER